MDFQEDYPYDWLMHWLAKQPAWGRSREFEITTRSAGRNGLTQTTTGDLEEEEEEDDGGLVHGRRKRKVAFMPSLDTTHTIYYRGHWLRITRTKRYPDYDQGVSSLKISVVARNNDILKKLVLEAKREYEKDAEHRHLRLLAMEWGQAKETHELNCSSTWREGHAFGGLQRFPLLRGMNEEYRSEEDTYFTVSLAAGELGLDIYVVSLSSKGMSDNTLTTLMSRVPSRCILLLEDLDAAFTRSVSRDATSTGAPTASTCTTSTTAETDGSTLSLSGLLNSLDGVAAAEGRLLFATTNHIERLDPALSRPGRMDVWVNFTHATKWQAEGIFKCFFPFKPATAVAVVSAAAKDASQKNLPLPKRKAPAHALPLLTEDEISELAKRFAEAIPEDELSVASLQGYLLKNKTRPCECVEEVDVWIIQERETREKLKKEKAEREAKEKKEKEEKEAKEKEEKEAKEKLERKEARAKAKKQPLKEAAAKEAAKSDSFTTAETTPTETTPATTVDNSSTTESSSASSSSSESESTGVDADTEESVTSEDEAEKEEGKEKKEEKEKWVAVKGQTTTTTAFSATPPTDADP
ncbi:hypothetical protein D9615_009926 [Tricholomella constricta]|uniref:BCS1 N-terminal domain-containing protein n=1 Tax=Tricholomella constricta TaxID=117010 RepID=A0A8H5GZC7_9AGAR|nr:hypothetical protein D9615_009926 [Tricholomella constricta]